MNNQLIKAFRLAEANFFEMLSLERWGDDNISTFVTGVKAANLNPVIVHAVGQTFPESLSSCRVFYADKQLPWALLMPEYHYNAGVGHLLKEQHFIHNDNGMAMVHLLDGLDSPGTDLSYRVREMDDALEEWGLPLLLGFESTPEITDVYVKRHSLAVQKSGELYHFSGFIGDQVVCSLSLSIIEGYARIDDVATSPLYQRNGYATALMLAALNRAKEQKAKACFLEASDVGLNVYKNIGFLELFKNFYYEIAE